jgi:hypothetical protein
MAELAQIGLDFSAKPAPEPTSVPGEHLKDVIRREVLAVLVVLARGRANAMKGRVVAELVTERLRAAGREVNLAPRTMKRRCEEAVPELIAAGEDLASASSPPYGYYVPETAEEIADGGREIWSRVAALAKRGRKYDRNTADRVLEFLGQLGIPVGGTTP